MAEKTKNFDQIKCHNANNSYTISTSDLLEAPCWFSLLIFLVIPRIRIRGEPEKSRLDTLSKIWPSKQTTVFFYSLWILFCLDREVFSLNITCEFIKKKQKEKRHSKCFLFAFVITIFLSCFLSLFAKSKRIKIK